jgi:hypothetical protein
LHHGALYPQAPDALAPPVLRVMNSLFLKATDSRIPRIAGLLNPLLAFFYGYAIMIGIYTGKRIGNDIRKNKPTSGFRISFNK